MGQERPPGPSGYVAPSPLWCPELSKASERFGHFPPDVCVLACEMQAAFPTTCLAHIWGKKHSKALNPLLGID